MNKSIPIEGIVEFGKRVFDDYYSKKISLERLIKLIDERETSNNDIAVLGCYCEKDVEVTYRLHQIQIRKESKRSHKEFLTEPYLVKTIGMIVMAQLENSAISLDRYFACDRFRFAEMVVDEYRKSWGKNYPKLFAEIEKSVKHFNFPSWNHIFKTYIK